MDGIVTFNATARKASVVFAATLIPSLCGWSPAFAQQPTNWMREHVQASRSRAKLEGHGCSSRKGKR